MRLQLVRRSSGIAAPGTIRRRDLRVLNLGPWLLIFVPRDHWSAHL